LKPSQAQAKEYFKAKKGKCWAQLKANPWQIPAS